MIVVNADALNIESSMSFNLIDLILAGYIGWGIWRGRRRGLTTEATRTILLLLAVLTGYGLARWTGKALGQLATVTGQGTGPLGVLGVMIATYVLARHFRRQLQTRIAKRFPDEQIQRKGGATAGGIRALVLGSTLVVLIGLMPLGVLSKPFNSGSLVGRNLRRYVVPAYQAVTHRQDHGTDQPSPTHRKDPVRPH
jgi:uncharacterized membrane protein required for colicin V production